MVYVRGRTAMQGSRRSLVWFLIWAWLFVLIAGAAGQEAAPAKQDVEDPANSQEKPPQATSQDKPQEEKPPEKPSENAADKSSEKPPEKPADPDTREAVCLMIEAAARANDLPLEFFARVIWQESRFQSDAVGPLTRRGERAQGIAQFMPGTASERRRPTMPARGGCRNGSQAQARCRRRRATTSAPSPAARSRTGPRPGAPRKCRTVRRIRVAAN